MSRPNGKQFELINVTHPSQLTDRNIRRQVRKHATKEQYRIRREAQIENERRSASSVSEQDVQDDEEESSDLRVQSSALHAAYTTQKRAMETRKSPVPISSLRHQALTRAVHPHQTVTLQDDCHGLGAALDSLGFDLQRVINHYIFICEAQVSLVSKDYAQAMRQRVQNFWVPFLMADPASASVTILLSVMSKLKALDYDITASPGVWRLHGLTIQAVQQALDDPHRASNDNTIVCVANMAIHEAIQGNKNNYQIHWQALARMVDLRGGLAGLTHDGERDIDRIVVWYDMQCAQVLGIRPYYDENLQPFRQRKPRRSEPPVFDPVTRDLKTFSDGVIRRVSGVKSSLATMQAS